MFDSQCQIFEPFVVPLDRTEQFSLVWPVSLNAAGFFVGFVVFSLFYGEFDPGSGRTLAACLTHASRTVKSQLAGMDQWRTGE